MADGANEFDCAVRMNNPVLQLVILPVADCLLHGLDDRFSVIRMDSPHPVAHVRHPFCGIETKQAVMFLGRIGHPSIRDVVGPAAGVADALCLRQIGLAALQGLFGALSPLDVGCRSIPPDDLSGFVAQRPAMKQEPAIFTVGSSSYT